MQARLLVCSMSPPEIHYFRENNEKNNLLWKCIREHKQVDGVFHANKKKISKLCRTSCTSRSTPNPNREDFVWFKTLHDGKRFGYMPCRRCHAANPNYKNPRERIEIAKQLGRQEMALNGRAPTLGNIAFHLKLSYEYCQRCFYDNGFSWSKFCKELLAIKEATKIDESIEGNQAQKKAVASNNNIETTQIEESMVEDMSEQNQNFSSSTRQLLISSVPAVDSVSQMEQLSLPSFSTRDKLVDPRSLQNVIIDSYENESEDTGWQIPPPMTTATATSSVYGPTLSSVSCTVGKSKVHDPTLLADENIDISLDRVSLLLNVPDFSMGKSDKEFEEEMDHWI